MGELGTGECGKERPQSKNSFIVTAVLMSPTKGRGQQSQSDRAKSRERVGLPLFWVTPLHLSLIGQIH